jgi:hypothetical protein
MAGRTGQKEEKTFWHLLQQAGKPIVVHAVAAPSDIRPAVTAGDWDFCLVVCTWRPEALSAAGRLTVWQAFDEVLARIKTDAGAQTAVMVLGLPTSEDEGLLIAGGGFFAAAGDMGTVDLLDVAPTVLWLAKPRTSLDVPVGGTMPGRVLDEIWAETGWSDEEREVLFKHLQGLGYLA